MRNTIEKILNKKNLFPTCYMGIMGITCIESEDMKVITESCNLLKLIFGKEFVTFNVQFKLNNPHKEILVVLGVPCVVENLT
jgi:hypothetical protein